MDVVAEALEILLVSDDVLPETALPHAAFAPARRVGESGLSFASLPFAKEPDRKIALYPFPSRWEIRIAARQAPDAMKVVGQHDHRNRSELKIFSNRPQDFAKKADVFLAVEDSPAPVRDRREEIGFTRDHPATVCRQRNTYRRFIDMAFLGPCHARRNCRVGETHRSHTVFGGFHPPYGC